MCTLPHGLGTGTIDSHEGGDLRDIGLPGPFWEITVIALSCFSSLSGSPRRGVRKLFSVRVLVGRLVGLFYNTCVSLAKCASTK